MTHISETEIVIFTAAIRDYFSRLSHDPAEIQGAWLLAGTQPPPLSDFTGIIAISGGFTGCVYFTAPRSLIRHILVSLKEADHSDATLLDAVGEVANTIAGNARRHFGEEMHISVPITISGNPERIQTPVRSRPYAIQLRWKHYEALLIVDIDRHIT